MCKLVNESSGEDLPPLRTKDRKTVIEFDGKSLPPRCTRSKKQGNDFNRCTFIVLFLQNYLMNLLKSPFLQDVLGARRKVYNKLNRCTSIV